MSSFHFHLDNWFVNGSESLAAVKWILTGFYLIIIHKMRVLFTFTYYPSVHVEVSLLKCVLRPLNAVLQPLHDSEWRYYKRIVIIKVEICRNHQRPVVKGWWRVGRWVVTQYTIFYWEKLPTYTLLHSNYLCCRLKS